MATWITPIRNHANEACVINEQAYVILNKIRDLLMTGLNWSFVALLLRMTSTSPHPAARIAICMSCLMNSYSTRFESPSARSTAEGWMVAITCFA